MQKKESRNFYIVTTSSTLLALITFFYIEGGIADTIRTKSLILLNVSTNAFLRMTQVSVKFTFT